MPATPETISIFNDALSTFKKSLTPEECMRFKEISAAKVEAEAKKIEQKHQASRKAQNMARIGPFVKAMLGYKNVLNIFTQANDLMVFIWGPVCFLLETASKWIDALDKLLDALESMGESLAFFDKFSDLLKQKLATPKDPQYFDLTMMLGRVYTDILDILLLSMKIFPRNVIKQIGIAVWPPFDRKLKNVLEKFEKYKVVLESALLAENFAQARKWQKEIEQRFIEQEQRLRVTIVESIRHALQPAAPSTKVQDAKDILQQRSNAGDWLLKTDQLKQWMNPTSGSGVVLLTGNPGVGKSILSAIVAEATENSFSSLLNCRIFMAFLSYQEGQNRTCLSILSSLLYQVLIRDWHFYQITIEKYGPDLYALSKSKRQLRDALVDIIACGPAFFIIDGFDEISKEERRELMEILRHIYKSPAHGNIKLFLSSRPEPDFLRETSRMNPPPAVVKITADSTNGDMESYLLSDKNMSILRDIHQYGDEKARNLLLAVGRKSSGMFLYAKLVLAEFEVQTCPREVEEAIENLPRGLEEAYDRVFQRMNTPGPRRKRAIRLLELLLKARRQLRVAEVAQAIMIDDIFEEYDECNTLTIPIEELGGGLVEIRDHCVSFVHFSVYEYLLKEDQVFKMKESDIDTSIATLCIRHLCMGSVRLKLKDEKLQKFITRGEYAFLLYAYENWLHHVKMSQSNGRPLPVVLRSILRVFCELHFREFLLSSDEPDPVQACLLATERNSQDKKKPEEEVTVKDPSDLTDFVSEVNLYVKFIGQHSSQEMLNRLEHWYGGIYRCSRTNCGSFTVGFSNNEDLKSHERKHLRDFICPHVGCPWNSIGLPTQTDLESHMKSHEGTTATDFDISGGVPDRISIMKDIINADLMNRIFMNAILQQDRGVLSTIKQLKSENFDFKKLTWLPEAFFTDKQLRGWLELIDLEPSFLLEAAVQCEDDSICQTFLETWEETNQHASKIKHQETVYTYLLYFAASKGLSRNVSTLLQASRLKFAKNLRLEKGVDFLYPRQYRPYVSPLLFAIYSGNQATINILLPFTVLPEVGDKRAAMNIDVYMLYTALGVCHEFAVKTILGFPQMEKYKSPLGDYRDQEKKRNHIYDALAYTKSGPEAVAQIFTLLVEADITPEKYIRWDRIMRYSNNIHNMGVLDILLELAPPGMSDAEFLGHVVSPKNKKRAAVALHLLEAGWDPILPPGVLRGTRRKNPKMVDFEKFVGKTWEQAMSDAQETRDKRREEKELAKDLGDIKRTSD